MSNKLTLKKIRAKNFRSVGNMPLELDYVVAPTTLIASENNGSGKSTLAIWALFFAFFGKPYKQGAKIGSLVNSKSNKDCLVEVEFETGGTQWLVKRGYKPGLFEIHKDGKLIENEAANNDMQRYLQSVIHMDERAFCNIVALGVDRFVPFVQMGAPERRSFVEQMLDMIIISTMNKIAKDKAKAVRSSIDQLHYDISMLESKQQGRNRTVGILEAQKSKRLSESDMESTKHRIELDKIKDIVESADKKIAEIEARLIPGVNEKIVELNNLKTRFETKLSEVKRNSDKVVNLHDCPTCKQGVTEEHKALIAAAAEVEAGKLTGPLEKLEGELVKWWGKHDFNEKEIKPQLDKIRVARNNFASKISGLEMLIKQIEAKKVDVDEDGLIQKEQDEIAIIESQITDKNKLLVDEMQVEKNHLHLLQILKDDGVKASIVSQYLPYLNQTINSILDRLNLYVQVNIDSEFNISLFAPDRKGQTIENLSTGQCRRIDLAVLIAWREIAKKKASVDCNILILDEILENLSATGVEEFMDMWEQMGQETNLIVITQRAAEFDQFFDRRISYKLVNDMTVECQ